MITVPMIVTKRIILNLGNIDSIFLLDESLLEPIVLKGTRWVLRREGRSNPPDLSDYSLDGIEYAHKKGITALIPDYNDAVKNNGTKSDNPHAKPNLYFDPVLKFFRCVMGKKLTITGTRMNKGIEYDVFKTKFCEECPLHDECTSSSYRELFEPHNETFYIRKQDFLSENGKYLYKFRAIYSEGFLEI